MSCEYCTSIHSDAYSRYVVCARACCQMNLFFSHPPADKVTSDIKVPLYPARDVPYELLIKAFVGQKTR